MSHVRFISAVLTPSSVEKLLLAVGKPKYAKVFAHHCTLAYNPTDEQVRSVLEFIKDGDRVELIPEYLIWNDGVEALVINTILKEFPDDAQFPIRYIHSTNKVPHITISTDGKPPKESNTLLNNLSKVPKDQKVSLDFFTLDAIIKVE